MSGTYEQRTERLEHEPTLPSPEKHRNLPEHAETSRQAEQARAESLVKAREKVAELAKAEHDTLKHEILKSTENDQDNYAGSVNSELKAITYHRELKNIRRKLNPSEKALSKTIHQPVIRVVSEAAGKTITRPSGLLGGGIMALLGSTAYLYLAKHVGFTYNYSVFLMLFVGGFGLGLVLELIIHLSLSSRRTHN